ncbi:hypothetical protein [Arsenicicoccus sp. oral taxon 190]|uniref:hypothetical protein n=1 Tax=Arsenicicoccus sp. oral taxon 190 TaxID=1658671 RepID=UPI00067CB2E5|nr:hypothetical protein [Arsenicicoccus sp. oral taxon 190]
MSLVLPPSLAGHPAFTRADALSAGLSVADLRQLTRVFHGVYALARPTSAFEQARMLSVVLPEGAALSHVTAARLLELPLPSEWLPEQLIDVLVPGSTHASRRPEVRDHRGPVPPHLRLPGLGTPVVAHEHVFAQLAGELPHEDLIILGDAVVGWRSGRTLDHLAAAIRPGHPGAVAALAALEHVREGSASPRETLLRLRFLEAGLPEPELNAAIYDSFGRLVAYLDMYWRRLRVGFEYDGLWHYASAQQREADVARIRRVEEQDVRVVVGTARDYPAVGGVVRRLRTAMAEQARLLGEPFAIGHQ